jgi:serine/threonine protein kinase
MNNTNNTSMKLIGEGKRGKVYLMKLDNGHKYAIKPLDLDKWESFNANKNLNRETRYHKYNEWREIEIYKYISQDLQLNWIVRLYSVIKKKPYAYLVMEYMPNGTLLANLESGFFNKKANCTNFVLQMDNIFENSCKIKFVHGDLHLENIMRKGRAWKLLDFSRAQICGKMGFEDCSEKLINQYDKKYFYGMLLNYFENLNPNKSNKCNCLREFIKIKWGDRIKPEFTHDNILVNYKEISNF